MHNSIGLYLLYFYFIGMEPKILQGELLDIYNTIITMCVAKCCWKWEHVFFSDNLVVYLIQLGVLFTEQHFCLALDHICPLKSCSEKNENITHHSLVQLKTSTFYKWHHLPWAWLIFPNSNGFQPQTALLNTLVMDPGMIVRLVTLAT